MGANTSSSRCRELCSEARGQLAPLVRFTIASLWAGVAADSIDRFRLTVAAGIGWSGPKCRRHLARRIMLPTSGDFSAWPHQPAKVDCHGEHGIGHVLQHAAVAAGTAGTFPGQRRAATAVAIVLALEAILTGPASGKWRLP